MHPRASILVVFYCVGGILSGILQDGFVDIHSGGQIFGAFMVGYGADTFNSQEPSSTRRGGSKTLVMILLAGMTMMLLWTQNSYASDARYCGVVNRVFPSGETKRSAAIKNQFKADWPCNTPCDATWQIDHVIPLIEGGCDAAINMAWMPPSIKSCAAPTKPGDPYCKDRWEQDVYRHDNLPVQWWYRGKKVPAP
jgi:hypothetical protein